MTTEVIAIPFLIVSVYAIGFLLFHAALEIWNGGKR